MTTRIPQSKHVCSTAFIVTSWQETTGNGLGRCQRHLSS